MTTGHIKLGALLLAEGGSASGWRHPLASTSGGADFAQFQQWAKIAEEGKLDLVFIADTLYITEKTPPQYLDQLEPISLLSALASTTHKIGLVGTVSTTYSEPYTVARQFGTLDKISGGRAGWNLVTSAYEGSALNYGKADQKHPEHNVRYQMADEHLSIVKGLWDSWEEDAFVKDKATGEYFNPDKLHALHHAGEFFQVSGPLNLSRSVQGQPVIFQAGSSEAGKAFSARHADAIFTTQRTLEDGIAFKQEIARRAEVHQRSNEDIIIFNGISPIIGQTAEEAEQKYEQLAALMDVEQAIAYLGLYFEHHDFSVYEQDAPFPDLGDLGDNSFKSSAQKIKQDALRNGWTLRQTAIRVATPRDPFTGTAERIANLMEEWYKQGATDGFLLFETIPGGLQDFTQQVVPILQARGLFRKEYEGDTLRSHLGLKKPAYRYGS